MLAQSFYSPNVISLFKQLIGATSISLESLKKNGGNSNGKKVTLHLEPIPIKWFEEVTGVFTFEMLVKLCLKEKNAMPLGLYIQNSGNGFPYVFTFPPPDAQVKSFE